MHLKITVCAPINTLLQATANIIRDQSWADDLESLGYVLIYFARGHLPWSVAPLESGQDPREVITKMKREMSPEDICSGLPDEFSKYLAYVRALPRDKDTRPNYTYLRGLFRKLFTKQAYLHDNIYDWTEKLFNELRAGNGDGVTAPIVKK